MVVMGSSFYQTLGLCQIAASLGAAATLVLQLSMAGRQHNRAAAPIILASVFN